MAFIQDFTVSLCFVLFLERNVAYTADVYMDLFYRPAARFAKNIQHTVSLAKLLYTVNLRVIYVTVNTEKTFTAEIAAVLCFTDDLFSLLEPYAVIVRMLGYCCCSDRSVSLLLFKVFWSFSTSLHLGSPTHLILVRWQSTLYLRLSLSPGLCQCVNNCVSSHLCN